MENTSTFINCECSDLMCDWKVSAAKVRKSNVFVLKEITPNHTCKRRNYKFPLRTKWNAEKFLHLWVQNPNIDFHILRYEIETCSGFKYPTWKLEAIDKTAKLWLRTDHNYGYERLFQYKNEMLKIDSPYKSVMLVAVFRDANNVVLPIVFCEVQEENFDSWSFFLKNLYERLCMDYMDYEKGICIMCDGDNRVDEAVSKSLPYAQYRQCCFSLYNKLKEQFPLAPVYLLFWAACKSTNKVTFQQHMMLLQDQNRDCYGWLINREYHCWALYCMPEWAKGTDITISAAEQLRSWLLKYLDMNVANRFTTITRETAKNFEKKVLGWVGLGAGQHHSSSTTTNHTKCQ
ncbi:hypothetical protein CUMW_186480 [Citrus unshiu]|nr:hypothetical protein CUMW_186480 [Citrus unshiu]